MLLATMRFIRTLLCKDKVKEEFVIVTSFVHPSILDRTA